MPGSVKMQQIVKIYLQVCNLDIIQQCKNKDEKLGWSPGLNVEVLLTILKTEDIHCYTHTVSIKFVPDKKSLR